MKCEQQTFEQSDNREMDGSDGQRTRSQTGITESARIPKESRVTLKKVVSKLESQGYRCPLTGWALTPESAGLDHVIPISAGGKHEMGNVAIVDAKVNRSKGTMSVREFVEMCMAVADWNRHKLEGEPTLEQ